MHVVAIEYFSAHQPRITAVLIEAANGHGAAERDGIGEDHVMRRDVRRAGKVVVVMMFEHAEQTRGRTLHAGYAQLVTHHARERGVECLAFHHAAAGHEPGALCRTVASLSEQ